MVYLILLNCFKFKMKTKDNNLKEQIYIMPNTQNTQNM